MTFAGLFQVALFLIADVVGEDAARKANDVPLKLFHFQQVSRTTLLFLAVATEIDTYCRFGNRETVDYLWAAFAGYAPEAEKMWKTGIKIVVIECFDAEVSRRKVSGNPKKTMAPPL